MTELAKKLIASQGTTARFPYLIRITHPDYPDGFYYANASEDITYNGKTYQAASFSITPPELDGSKIGNATLTISAVDQIWIARIRSTQKPAQISFVAVIIYHEGTIAGIEQLDEHRFTLRQAQWDETTIQWSMQFDERMGNIITSVKCTPQITPGCA